MKKIITIISILLIFSGCLYRKENKKSLEISIPNRNSYSVFEKLDDIYILSFYQENDINKKYDIVVDKLLDIEKYYQNNYILLALIEEGNEKMAVYVLKNTYKNDKEAVYLFGDEVFDVIRDNQVNEISFNYATSVNETILDFLTNNNIDYNKYEIAQY